MKKSKVHFDCLLNPKNGKQELRIPLISIYTFYGTRHKPHPEHKCTHAELGVGATLLSLNKIDALVDSRQNGATYVENIR